MPELLFLIKLTVAHFIRKLNRLLVDIRRCRCVGAGLKKNIVIDPSETRAYLLVGAGGDLNAPEESCARYSF